MKPDHEYEQWPDEVTNKSNSHQSLKLNKMPINKVAKGPVMKGLKPVTFETTENPGEFITYPKTHRIPFVAIADKTGTPLSELIEEAELKPTMKKIPEELETSCKPILASSLDNDADIPECMRFEHDESGEIAELSAACLKKTKELNTASELIVQLTEALNKSNEIAEVFKAKIVELMDNNKKTKHALDTIVRLNTKH